MFETPIGANNLIYYYCRTNCMDCLDRTNVVQSMLAAENLKLILVRMGVMKPSQQLKDFDIFQVKKNDMRY